MSDNIAYPNRYLGKRGWFYWALFPLVVGPTLFLAIFILAIFFSGYSFLEKSIIFLGLVFFLYYLAIGIKVLWLGSKTAKYVDVLDDSVIIKTYTGKTIQVLSKPKEIINVTQNLKKKHLRVLYPKYCNVISIKSNGKEYYLPVDNEGLKFFNAKAKN